MTLLVRYALKRDFQQIWDLGVGEHKRSTSSSAFLFLTFFVARKICSENALLNVKIIRNE